MSLVFLFFFVKQKANNWQVDLLQDEALTGFEPVISCLLDRRFNQLSHGAEVQGTEEWTDVMKIFNSRGHKNLRPTWGSNPRPWD